MFTYVQRSVAGLRGGRENSVFLVLLYQEGLPTYHNGELYRVTHGVDPGARNFATNLATSKMSMPVLLQNFSSVVPNEIALAGVDYGSSN